MIGSAIPAPERRLAWWGVGAALLAALGLVVLLLVADRLAREVEDGEFSGLAGVFRYRDHGTGVAIWGTGLLVGFVASTVMLFGAWVSAGANQWLLRANAVLIRVVLFFAVVFMFFFTDLPQLEAKSLTWRTIVYPSLTMLLPVGYWLRGPQGPYPWFIDVNWAFVFTYDIVSNDLHWYGTWYYWDAFVHFTNSIPFFATMLLVLLALERHVSAVAGYGTIAIFAVALFFALHGVWETYEFLADEVGGTELQTGGMREATIDNMTGLLGALVALLVITLWRDRGLLERLVSPIDGYLSHTVRGEPVAS